MSTLPAENRGHLRFHERMSSQPLDLALARWLQLVALVLMLVGAMLVMKG
jgi:hypothetical protein